MGKKKSLTIHKANEIVRGGDNLSVYGKRAFKLLFNPFPIQVTVHYTAMLETYNTGSAIYPF